MKLLVMAYVAISAMVLGICKELDIDKREELLLRFHRNGLAEEFVTLYFTYHEGLLE